MPLCVKFTAKPLSQSSANRFLARTGIHVLNPAGSFSVVQCCMIATVSQQSSKCSMAPSSFQLRYTSVAFFFCPIKITFPPVASSWYSIGVRTPPLSSKASTSRLARSGMCLPTYSTKCGKWATAKWTIVPSTSPANSCVRKHAAAGFKKDVTCRLKEVLDISLPSFLCSRFQISFVAFSDTPGTARTSFNFSLSSADNCFLFIHWHVSGSFL